MKKIIFMFLLIGAVMFFWSCTENNPSAPELSQSDQVTNSLAKKTAPSLTGTAHADFTFTPPTFWNGTITFGEETYGLTFFSFDAPRDYSQASPFYEEFIIYTLGTDWTNPDNVVMKGWDAGVVTNV